MDLASSSLDINLMRAAVDDTSRVVRALANPDRLLLLCQMSGGEKAVGELEELLGIHQPTLSQQLSVLRAEGLVNTRRDGKRIYYSVADQKVLILLQTLSELYCPKQGGNATC
jgi:ArsR family transcriptional regulator